MKQTEKRACFVLAIVAMLAADSAITWKLATSEKTRAGSAPAYSDSVQDPMARFRLEREQLRAQEEARLNDIIHAEGTDGQIVADAQRQLMDMLSRGETETTLEGLLLSRGFEDVIVSVSQGSASVLVRKAVLTQGETAVILELVMRQTGLTGGNVKIIPVK